MKTFLFSQFDTVEMYLGSLQGAWAGSGDMGLLQSQIHISVSKI